VLLRCLYLFSGWPDLRWSSSFSLFRRRTIWLDTLKRELQRRDGLNTYRTGEGRVRVILFELRFLSDIWFCTNPKRGDEARPIPERAQSWSLAGRQHTEWLDCGL
jgi:hypothetical protein